MTDNYYDVAILDCTHPSSITTKSGQARDGSDRLCINLDGRWIALTHAAADTLRRALNETTDPPSARYQDRLEATRNSAIFAAGQLIQMARVLYEHRRSIEWYELEDIGANLAQTAGLDHPMALAAIERAKARADARAND